MENRAEFYFVAVMMVLILIVCAIAVAAFFRTFKKEKAQRELEKRLAERGRTKAETKVEN